jgi:hypothetical protein
MKTLIKITTIALGLIGCGDLINQKNDHTTINPKSEYIAKGAEVVDVTSELSTIANKIINKIETLGRKPLTRNVLFYSVTEAVIDQENASGICYRTTTNSSNEIFLSDVVVNALLNKVNYEDVAGNFDLITSESAKDVLAHEIGHCFYGLKHSESEEDLMTSKLHSPFFTEGHHIPSDLGLALTLELINKEIAATRDFTTNTLGYFTVEGLTNNTLLECIIPPNYGSDYTSVMKYDNDKQDYITVSLTSGFTYLQVNEGKNTFYSKYNRNREIGCNEIIFTKNGNKVSSDL